MAVSGLQEVTVDLVPLSSTLDRVADASITTCLEASAAFFGVGFTS
jgi:hypothetical protein